MKTPVKTVFGVMISLAWLVAYVGAGAFLLARQAATNINHVAAYIPLVVFLWAVGFFVGHAAIKKLFLLILNPSSDGLTLSHFAARQLQSLDIDNLPAFSKPAPKKYPETYQTLKQSNNNNKKDTSKIASFSKNRISIYKVPQYC